jgi:hypothetical protein
MCECFEFTNQTEARSVCIGEHAHLKHIIRADRNTWSFALALIAVDNGDKCTRTLAAIGSVEGGHAEDPLLVLGLRLNQNPRNASKGNTLIKIYLRSDKNGPTANCQAGRSGKLPANVK